MKKGNKPEQENRTVMRCYTGQEFRAKEEDGKKLARDLETVAAMPGGREYYWEQVPMAVLKDRYHVAIRPCQAEDIQEIDTFSELKALDPSYENYGGTP